MTTQRHTAATLADVAKAAGVSRSTASRALNDSPRISEQTKRLIREVAKSIDYVPSARGRALAMGRSETIAVLMTEPPEELFCDPTYAAFMGGIIERLEESSYLPVILQASTKSDHERVERHFARRTFDALISLSPYVGGDLLQAARESAIPTVLLGRVDPNPYADAFSCVYSDDVEGARMAARAMSERGRKRVVAVLGPQDNPAVRDRLAGYREVYDADLSDDDVAFTGWGTSDGFLAMRRMLERVPDLDGVLAGSDRIAAGVLEALRETGRSVPGDVSVIGFDDHEVARRTSPALTTVRQPLREEGMAAASLALEMIEGEAPTTKVMHMSLVSRDSL